jgi:two-component system, chemotaxis family, CheB/CheR fusion protein
MRLRPYRTVDDKIDGVVITFVDVSDRHQVEEALRESERRLAQEKRLVDLSRDAIFVWEVDGGIVEWNRGSEELYGYSREEAIGRPKEQLLRTGVPGSSFSELKSKLIKEGTWVGELRHKTKEGHELTVESRLQLETFDSVRLVLESTRDITERRDSDRRQHLLMNELTHRVRNILAVIQAIARHTLRRSKAAKSIVEQFEGRLSALASAHNLLVESDWKGAGLGELARQQLKALRTENPNHLRIEGEPIVLPPELATPFGLVLHELATNAAKHGALSTSSGRVSVTWSVSDRDDHRALVFEWKEMNGPKVIRSTTSGFGSTLIQSAIPGAQVNREFRGDEFLCTIELDLPKST